MKVFVGIIRHRHGNNAYVSKTENGLYNQFANYCREWWHELPTEDGPPEDDRECVKKYFNLHYGYEEIFISETVCKD